MKKIFILSLLMAIILLNNGCKKDGNGSKVKTYTEEFVDVPNLRIKGWVFINNSSYNIAQWQQGQEGMDKGGTTYGFSAYSYKTNKNEYAFAGYISANSSYSISSWMISPVYEIKNGDKISFFTRSSPGTEDGDRLQVRLNEVDNTSDVGSGVTSVGKFTLLLKDINETLAVGAYPQTWTKYEITVSGLNSPKQTRIAFRYFPDPSKSDGIGIDQFSFTSL